MSSHQPKGLLEAYWFAKLEEKVAAARRSNQSGGFNKNKASVGSHRLGSQKTNQSVETERVKTPTQEVNRRTCWHCKEPWTPGHYLKCKVRKALHVILMQGEEMVEEKSEEPELAEEQGYATAPGSPTEVEHPPETEQLMMISSYALKGVTGPATFSLMTMIGGQRAAMLVDSDSTNSFMDYEFSIKSECRLKYKPTKRVAVAGGRELHTDAMIEDLSYIEQGY